MSTIAAANHTPVFTAPRAASQRTEATSTAPQDSVSTSRSKDEVTWGTAFRGLAAAIPTAIITGVGCTASSLLNDIPATIEAGKTIVKTPYIGRNLKAMSLLMLPVATVAAPILTAIGATGYGLYKGFVEGVEHGFGAALEGGAKDVKTFHNELSGKAVGWLREMQEAELPEGQQPFDVSISGAAKGLAGGLISGAVVGAGATLVVGVHSIPGAIKAGSELWSSDTALPLKAVGTIMIPPAVPLAVGLAPVAGVLYGVGMGAKDAYTKGFGEAVGNSFKAVGDLNKGLTEAIYK